MQLSCDDDFVEAAVFTVSNGKRAGAPRLLARRFHVEREQCCSILDADDRQAAFVRVHFDWFREWGLEELLLGVINELPLPGPGLTTLAFRKARMRKEEGAELYVSADNGRIRVVAMRAERFESDEAVRDSLRIEFMHLSDMIDPNFGYTPDLRAHGMNPSHQRIARERYRLLWDITINGRLGRGSEGERQRAVFNEAFAFWPAERRNEGFTKLSTNKFPKHDELLALAADPRDLSHRDKPLPGGRCPLYGFSTFDWADLALLDDISRASVQRESPAWSPSQGACNRCIEVYAIARRYAEALPQ